MTTSRWIEPQWPAPPRVRAAATLRTGGVSTGPYASMNLGSHVGDDPRAVAENRRRLSVGLGLPAEPVWLNQVHGVRVVEATPHAEPPTADASFARAAGQVCVVQTADCLPVLLCDRDGACVAAAHAGWRSLVGGVLDATINAMAIAPAHLMAWLGPAIEPDAFEVGPEVREQFLARDANHASAFAENARGRWQADLSALARRELARLGVAQVHGGGFRCYEDHARFFSYRRDSKTGRMAALIWLDPHAGG